MNISAPGRGDIVVLIISVVLVLMVYQLFWQSGGHSSEALVLVNGENWARLNLSYEQNLEVPGRLGVSHIEVRNGEARFVNSPCPTKQCLLQGGISDAGEAVVCLPNMVSIKVLGADPRFDAISF